jgi:hypothetical protein
VGEQFVVHVEFVEQAVGMIVEQELLPDPRHDKLGDDQILLVKARDFWRNVVVPAAADDDDDDEVDDHAARSRVARKKNYDFLFVVADDDLWSRDIRALVFVVHVFLERLLEKQLSYERHLWV